MMRKTFLIAVLLLVQLLVLSSPTMAMDKGDFKDQPTLLVAKNVDYNKELGVITATGDVEIEHSGRILHADKVSYCEKTNRVAAEGNVKIFEPNGEVIFMDHVNLSGDLKDGIIDEIKMILSDDSKFLAAKAKREGGTQSTFDRAVYSPCLVCKTDSNNQPLWQIKARRVVWDEKTEDIIYTDASMEFKGVPFLYTPYLRHPAPNVKRRSGLLAPFFGGSASYGTLIGVPYYWVIDRSSDATVTPMMVGSRPMLGLEYRQLFTKGRFRLNGSMTDGNRTTGTDAQPQTQSNRFRGHITGDGLAELDKNWRTGFSLERASDQTYLKKYGHLGLSGKNVLISKGYLEGFWNRSYATTQGYTFQGLRQVDSNAATPIILPKADFNYLSQPDQWGGVWTADGNVLALSRREGNDMQRVSLTSGWYAPYYSSLGHVVTSGFKLRGDYYHINDYQYSSSPDTFDGSLGRTFAQAYTNADWPFIKIVDGTRYVIEPRIGLVASPQVGYPQKLPNEDTRVIEFNDLNLMSDSRFAGLDRIDGGSRFNYGLNLAAYTHRFGNADLFFGQSLAFTQPRDYLKDTGMHNKVSDYVGRLKFTYQDWLILRERVLMERKHFSAKRNEVSALIGKPWLRFGADYILLPKITNDPLDKKGEQVRFSLSSEFTPNWSAMVSTTRELGKGGGTLAEQVGLQYKDECFTVNTTLEKTFYYDRDMRPGLTLMCRFVFKNLGEFKQGTRVDGN